MILTNESECRLKTTSEVFYLDVMQGLTQEPKKLSSKYFYDKKGDSLFQAIMMSPDYYLTRCEMEIFACHTHALAESVTSNGMDFELIELGPGNCAKSIHLLQAFAASNVSFNYVPIDISENVISRLKTC